MHAQGPPWPWTPYGGCVYANPFSSLVIRSSHFKECSASGAGGAVYAETLSVDSSSFSHCTAASDAGVIYVAGPDVRDGEGIPGDGSIKASEFLQGWSNLASEQSYNNSNQ